MRTVWQISGGQTSQPCADILLESDVGIIGPGDAGPWTPERDDDDEWDLPAVSRDEAQVAGGFVRRLASEVFPKAQAARGPDFLRLANALSPLYPKGSEEKRLLDAMLLAVPR